MALFTLVGAIAFSSCSGGGGGGSSTNEGEEDTSTDEYYNLNLSSQNKITRGKDIYDAVTIKYTGILSAESIYYEDDNLAAENFQRFRDMVNTKLIINPESLISPSDDLYNHNSLQIWGESDLTVQYEDGTTETIPAAEILANDGGINPDYVNSEKKIAKILSKLSAIEDAVEAADALTPPLNEVITVDVEDVNVEVDGAIKEYWDNGAQVSWDVGKTIMKGLCSLLPIGEEGLLAVVDLFDSWMPFEDEDSQKLDIINSKLDNITNLLVGLYTNLDYLKQELEQMQFEIAENSMTDMWTELEKIRIRVMANLNTIQNQVDFDKKADYASIALLEINTDIQEYITFSIEYYKNYIELVKSLDDNEYAVTTVKLEMPWYYWSTTFSAGTLTEEYKPFTIEIPIDNPETYLPFQTSKLKFLKVLYFTSLKYNSYMYLDEEDLNEVNSNFIHSYLALDGQYLDGLRNDMLTAWSDWRSDAKASYAAFYDTALAAYNAEIYSVSKSGDIARWNYGAYPDPSQNNNPKIIINGDKEFTLTKAVTDPAFLTDAQTIVRNYTEAKRYHLLEFAASMAALEIQMASYLDDEDFEDYKNH